MKIFISATLVSLVIVVSGCADVSSISRNDSREVVINSQSKAYVSIPYDGRYGQQTYVGSGRTTAGIVLAAFSTKMLHVDIAENTESFEEALESARKERYQYLIAPKITHWEDRNTAWSGRPSKASVNIRIIDVKTGGIIDSAIIDSRSSSMRLTDPAPEDALPAPAQEYLDSLTFN